jgi:hypothetical protein
MPHSITDGERLPRLLQQNLGHPPCDWRVFHLVEPGSAAEAAALKAEGNPHAFISSQNGSWTSESSGRSLEVIEPPAQSDRAFNPLHRRTFSSVLPLSHRSMSGVRRCVMVETPLAFDFSKTRTICDAFEDAWAILQGLGGDLTEASKSLGTRTILAKRIIEMADQGLTDVPELRDDALAFLQRNPPSADRSMDSLNANVVSGFAGPLPRGE